jgi:hypothetical protein
MVDDTQYVLWQASFLHRAQQAYHSNGYLKKLHEAELVETFPKNPTGKFLRCELKEFERARRAASRPCSTAQGAYGLEEFSWAIYQVMGVRVYAKM